MPIYCATGALRSGGQGQNATSGVHSVTRRGGSLPALTSERPDGQEYSPNGNKLVRYELAGGGSIVVEEAVEDRGGLVGASDVIAAAGQRFEDALATIRPAIAAVMAQVEALVEEPDEVALELGFSLSGEVGAVLAKTAGEGSLKLSLKWQPRAGSGQDK